jgi:hypothetical protein
MQQKEFYNQNNYLHGHKDERKKHNLADNI